MRIPGDVHAQLSAAANAADRANRPASLLGLAIVLLVVGALVLGWSQKSMAGARARLTGAVNTRADAESKVAQIRSLRDTRLELESVFPHSPYVSVKIEELGEKVFGRKPTVKNPESNRRGAQSDRLGMMTIECSVSNEPIDKVLRWMNAIRSSEELGVRAFFSRVTLQTTQQGWNASFEVSWYRAL